MAEQILVAVPVVEADTNDRRTPQWFFELCEARFGPFYLDVAANQANALCPVWYGPGSPFDADGLTTSWAHDANGRSAWCNPPYGPNGTIQQWIEKARRERAWGIRTLMLLPADTSTKWYHDVTRTELTELVTFRLAFDAPDGSTKGNSAKFGSVLVWIAPQLTRPLKARRVA